MMRFSFTAGLLLSAVAAVSSPTRAQAQDDLDAFIARGQVAAEGGDYQMSGRPEIIAPIPTGNPSGNGFFYAAEFLYYQQSFALGKQVIAQRGLVDSSGLVTGTPGTFIGSGQVALDTASFGRRSDSPGWRQTLGYKFDNGVSVYLTFSQLFDQTYAAGASLATFRFANQGDLADSYLFSPVFNFPPDYAGPLVKTGFDLTNNDNFGGNFYGIWNGASVMNLTFKQRFTTGDLAARVPLLQTDYSRVYGIGGARYAWFYEKLWWRTVSYDVVGRAFPADSATYTNTLSQRMYGPMAGCGHEVYIGKRFGVSLDLTGSLLFNIQKERVYYELGDKTTKAKRSVNEFDVTPNGNLDLNLMWYPIEGVQVKLGYNFQGYFNTKYMQEPVAFNFGALDPPYGTQAFRYVQGLSIGMGLFF